MAEAGLDAILLCIAQGYDLGKRFAVDLLKVGFNLACLGDNYLLKYPGTLIDKGNREGNGWGGE